MSSKNTSPFAGWFVFLGIQPLLAAATRWPRLVRITTHSGSHPRSLGLSLGADKQLVGIMANHGSI
jgi:hypothetical protein